MMNAGRWLVVLQWVLSTTWAHGNHEFDDHAHGLGHSHEDHRQLGGFLYSLFSSENNGGRSSHKCGSRHPTDKERGIRERVVQNWRSRRQNNNNSRELQSIVIPVCFHSLAGSEENPTPLSNSAFQEQLDALNQAFSSTSCCDTSQSWCDAGDCSVDSGISFAMAVVDGNGDWVSGSMVPRATDSGACVTQTVNAEWDTSGISSELEREMSTALRRGDAGVLNVYIRNIGGGALGVATYPWFYEDDPIIDGAHILFDTVVGGSNSIYNEGDTMTHEVGHWLGLFHTFDGRCGRGDGIDDTSPEKRETYGCPVRKNSCRLRSGRDPIHNFMDYSDDVCLYEFTPNQVDVMQAAWEEYRT